MSEATPPASGIRRTIIESREFAEIYRSWLAAIANLVRPGEPWAIVGIKERGSVLARRLWNDLSPEWEKAGSEKPAFGEVDISLYRDDYHLQARKPQVLGTEIPFPVDGRRILLVDDVLFTGRTVRAAIDLILDFGRPRRILLAVFIDRGHRELPIAPDFIGRRLSTALDEQVKVRCREAEGEDRVELTVFSRGGG
jgi:pyrimidine operon attenuation protein/uracil phosphoribosyltransferase